MKSIAIIPLGQIDRLGIYINTGKKSLAAIKSETGADYIINGGVYDMSAWKAYCHLRADGRTWAEDEYCYQGYGWDAEDIREMPSSEKQYVRNYICCVELIREGEPLEKLVYNSDLGGVRGRSAMGLTKDGALLLWCSKDGGSGARSPETLRDELSALGAQSAIMLDGGGSSQCDFDGQRIASSRVVHDLICVYLKKTGPHGSGDGESGAGTGTEVKSMDTPVIDYQPTTKSDVWPSTRTIKPSGLVLHSTAWPGKDAQAIRDNFNTPDRGASIHAAVDDKQVIQCLPWTKRAGHVGSGRNGSFNNTHIGIEMCEPVGLTYNRKGSAITAYDPPAGYFAAVWERTVELFAWLCEVYGLDPLEDIVSHAEAHALGYGDNHADTAHWFRWEGLTMDDFRKAVDAKMKGEDEEMTYEKWKEYMERYMNEPDDSPPGSWAADSCQKAIDNGVMLGNGQGAYNFQKPLTREAYVVMQDRQGLL